MYRNPSRPSSSYGETVSVVGRKRTQVAESPATFRPIVGSFERGRCRRWITGFSTGQLVPSSSRPGRRRAIEKVEASSIPRDSMKDSG